MRVAGGMHEGVAAGMKSCSWYREECRAIREPSGKNHFIYNLSNSTSHTANRFAFGF